MANANTAAIGKVELHGPGVSHNSVDASLQPGQSFLAVCQPTSARLIEREQGNYADKPVNKSVDKSEPAVGEHKPNGVTSGLVQSVGDGKSVKATSVPQSPLNNSSTVGGPPRLELKITEKPASAATEARSDLEIEPEPVVSTGVQGSEIVPATSVPQEDSENKKPPEATKSVEELKSTASDSIVSKGRALTKAAGPASKEPVINGPADSGKYEGKPEAPVTHSGPLSDPLPAPAPAPTTASVAPLAPIADNTPSRNAEPSAAVEAAKPPEINGSFVGNKRKIDEASISHAGPLDKKTKMHDITAQSKVVPIKHSSSSPKVSKFKKEKRLPPIGRTARKTRSQGPADL